MISHGELLALEVRKRWRLQKAVIEVKTGVGHVAHLDVASTSGIRRRRSRPVFISRRGFAYPIGRWKFRLDALSDVIRRHHPR